jgi:hypothetical protein
LFDKRDRLWPALVMPALGRRDRVHLHAQRHGRRLRRCRRRCSCSRTSG